VKDLVIALDTWHAH
jgi:hypothetical protein